MMRKTNKNKVCVSSENTLYTTFHQLAFSGEPSRPSLYKYKQNFQLITFPFSDKSHTSPFLETAVSRRPFIRLVVFQKILFCFVSFPFGGCYNCNCGLNKWNCVSYKYKCVRHKLNCVSNKYKIGCYNLFGG